MPKKDSKLKKEKPKKEVKVEEPKKDEKPKKPSIAKLKKEMDKSALNSVHAFMGKYFDLDEKDDKGHEDNESKLIESLCNIYDPEEETETAKSKVETA